MFVAVTLLGVIAGWLAHGLSWIRDRRAVVNAHLVPVDGSRTLMRGREDSPFHFRAMDRQGEATVWAPGPLWLLGERGYGTVRIDFGAMGYKSGYVRRNRDLSESEQAELERIKRLFPEAQIDASARYHENVGR
jgi:hypothetical protein